MVVVRADAILRLSPLSTATAWAGSSTRTSRASRSMFLARMVGVVSMRMSTLLDEAIARVRKPELDKRGGTLRNS
jgi:hypothetical protein